MHKISKDEINLSNWIKTVDKLPDNDCLTRALYYSEEPREFKICLLRYNKKFSQYKHMGCWEGEKNYKKSHVPEEYYAPVYWQLASSPII
jgi:hypothetical protein